MNRLKQLRREKGLSQIALSKKVKIGVRTIQYWEKNQRQIRNKNTKKLADFFGVSVAYFLGYESRRTTEITYEGLSELIKQWSDKHKITQSDPKIQWMRVTEEIGEIRDVLLKPTKFDDPEHALKDAIGDSLVTLIVLSHQLNVDTVDCLEIAYNAIKDRQGKMVNGTFVKQEDL